MDAITITWKNNENIPLPIGENSSLIETQYLLSNEANKKHLMKSISQHKAGKAKTHELIENE